MEYLDKICRVTGIDILNDNKCLRNVCQKVDGLKPAYPVLGLSLITLLLLAFDVSKYFMQCLALSLALWVWLTLWLPASKLLKPMTKP